MTGRARSRGATSTAATPIPINPAMVAYAKLQSMRSARSSGAMPAVRMARR